MKIFLNYPNYPKLSQIILLPLPSLPIFHSREVSSYGQQLPAMPSDPGEALPLVRTFPNYNR